MLQNLLKRSGIGLIAGVLILSGCASSNQNQRVTTDERTRIVENSEFGVRIPREWDVIEPKDFTSEVPRETQLVFLNNIKNEDYTATVNITKNVLLEPKVTLDYAKEKINQAKQSLYNFKEIKRDVVKIPVGGQEIDTYIITYEGKQAPDQILGRFNQTFAVKDKSAYIITGTYSTVENANTIAAVEDMIKSFSLK